MVSARQRETDHGPEQFGEQWKTNRDLWNSIDLALCPLISCGTQGLD